MTGTAPDPAPARVERVGENLNRALHTLFAATDRLFLLGEDVADPYGGAFRITRGLSTAYPDRVLSTPLSENGVVGVAGGLALCGDTVLVEIMFGDFVGLAFDQILNFATKSVTMYGVRTPMRLVVRCPVGGGRGYGATHSQSVQKHFIGVPNLALYELSPFHDAAEVLGAAIALEQPCLLFEDKVLYTRRMFRDGEVDDRFRFELFGADRNWARAYAPDATGPPTLLIAPGGVAHRALDAARSLLAEGRNVEVLVPARLYPVGVADLVGRLDGADGVWVAEESTAGGTWGAEVAARLHETAWDLLRGPVGLINSADSVIPAAPHLERAMLVGAETIRDRIRAGGRPDTGAPEPVVAEVPVGHGVLVPKLNNNDAGYVLVEWLVADGAPVEAGEPVAAVETSKATEELVAEHPGVLRHGAAEGADCVPGEAIGQIVSADGPPAEPPAALPAEPSAALRAGPPAESPAVLPAQPAASLAPPAQAPAPAPLPVAPGPSPASPVVGRPLPAAQRRVAAVVAASHRDIPAAFTAVRLDLDAAMAQARKLTEETGASVGLPELLIKAAAGLHATHPGIFATLTPDGLVVDAERPVIGVTVDVGAGLYTPVLRDVPELSVSDVADALAGLRMKTLRTRLREEDLTGMNLLVALNNGPGVVIAQPIVPPGVTCALSLPDTREEIVLTADGSPRARVVADLGLAYDHRLVNGAEAAAFLADVGAALAAPGV